jgi:hypothetical protein
MTTIEGKYFTPTAPDSPEFPNRYFCILFSDMIVRDLCLLRRRELNGKRQFSCSGCSKDRLLHNLENRRIPLYHRKS